MYQTQNLEIRKFYAIDLIKYKIRALNALAKLTKEISILMKKDYIYFGLEKKDVLDFQDNLYG